MTEPSSQAPNVRPRSDVVAVPVWDLPVRFVHWAIVVLLAGLITTGLVGNEWLEWHMRFGQAMLALIVFRVIWGFVGSRNARFASFLRGPAAASRYARSLVRAPHEVHATHNPVGGWMVVALLVALVVQATTGLFTNDDAFYGGPLSERIAKATSDAISTVHRWFWWVVASLAAVHVVAVLAYLIVMKDDLVSAIVTGRKWLPADVARPADAVASTAKAAVLLCACAAVVWYALNRL